jgi:ATP adenylyltransferase
MPQSSLYAPWRMEYIRSLDKAPDAGCFICNAVSATSDQERKDRLVLWSTDHSIVIINKFPYSSGHILVSPKGHKAEMEELTDEELLDVQVQSAKVIRLLKRAISPQGFNLGVNLGRCAGAGMPGHFHQHVVPRWSGDTNFLSVVGDVRVVPQAMAQLYEELMRALGTTAT